MKNIADSFSRFAVKSIFCIAFGLPSSACYLLKSIDINKLNLEEKIGCKQTMNHVENIILTIKINLKL